MNCSKSADEKPRPNLPIEYVLDASVILAMIQGERGAEQVEDRLPLSCISAVNLTEAAARLMRKGSSEHECLAKLGFFKLGVIAYDEPIMRMAVSLSAYGWTHGISLADRACIATAAYMGRTAVTADRRWLDLNLPCPVLAIR